MRITLILCLLMQFVFARAGNEQKFIVPHTESLHANHFNSNLTSWSLESMLMLYPQSGLEDDSIKVYPNPVNRKDMLNISMTDPGKKRLAFYDITGKMVKVIETERTSFSFSVQDLGTGVYILNVSAAKFQTTKKVIVK
ncbi:T9SS type A sorting domain-containing protein [Galbibacter mesophilus]|uniref:T9SS type A sorting domain-containing protein n=1 Tax=Galbibacter mesophilus TaxID=379069 RepID=UPI00191E706E|nr:T9SS type A sorting domain-containing protein [Galbibacter mesophilus]MCM5663275.1 T9SS type A sorting domain-containing protein [Galbibacter mesophilus]